METAREVSQLLSGGMTMVIAIIALYIAWRQHRTARDRLKLDLYDRRFRVYRGLVDLFRAVLDDGDIPSETLAKYYSTTNEKVFLFDDDLVEYMKASSKKAIQLRQNKRRLESPQIQSNEAKLETTANENAELFLWFGQELEILATRFKPYLDFTKNL